MVSRREFLKIGAATGAAAFIATRAKFLMRAYGAPLVVQTPLPAKSIPQFIQPLPLLSVQDGGSMETIVAGDGEIALSMEEFQVNILPPGIPGVTPTYVWGYRVNPAGLDDTYIGPVIVAKRDQPTQVRYTNNLGFADPYGGTGSKVTAYVNSTDQTLHWADPLNDGANEFAHMAMFPEFGSPASLNYTGPIAAVPHLHGGEVPSVLDGGPEAWFTSDGLHHGAAYYQGLGALNNEAICRYPNSQEAAPIWFHDHTLGATRLNVYAGLAGAYILTDLANPLSGDLNDPTKIIPLVLQDRSFDTTGQFLMPADSYAGIQWAPNPEHPYWVPEFVGDVIVINGKAWPFLNVQPAAHRFLFLNGSNARTYEMFLTDPVTKVNGPPMYVISTDGGYLDRAVKIDPNAPKGQLQRLVMMPGERYEVVIDFADPAWLALNPNFSGTLILKNIAKTPYPGGATPQGTTLGQMMQFRVLNGATTPTLTSFDPSVPLRSNPIQRLVDPIAGAVTVPTALTRQLTLNEVMGMPQTVTNPVTGVLTAYPGGPLEILVNNTKWSGKRITGVEEEMYKMEPIPGFVPDGIGNYLSELPNEGDTEVWEIVNLTADAHPIHTHLVQFQIISRQNFDVKKYSAAYDLAFPGGGYDPMTMLPYPPNVFIPGFGPPLSYEPSVATGGKYGGNPDVTPFLKGPASPPLANEAGWKDTVVSFPGQVTRFAIRWAPNSTSPGVEGHFPFNPGEGQGYVWHCHIIDHEDNEMMRPNAVTPKTGVARTYIQGEDY